jgi:hypothetical protein
LFDSFLSLDTPITEKILAVFISYFLSCSIIYIYEQRNKK